MTRISVMVGSLFSDLKYSWQNFRSARSIASPRSSRNLRSASSSIALKPRMVSTRVGISYSIFNVLNSSSEASLASTGLMTYFFTASTSASVRSPVRI